MPQTLSSGSSVAFLLESTANLYSAMVLQSGMTISILEAIARAPRTVSRSSSVSLPQASGVTPVVNRRRFFKSNNEQRGSIHLPICLMRPTGFRMTPEGACEDFPCLFAGPQHQLAKCRGLPCHVGLSPARQSSPPRNDQILPDRENARKAKLQ